METCNFITNLERSSLTEAVSGVTGDTEELEGDLYMAGSWMERSDMAETIAHQYIDMIVSQFSKYFKQCKNILIGD